MHYLTIHYILIVAAFIVALLGAFQLIVAPRINLVALALMLFFLSLLVGCSTRSVVSNKLAQDTVAAVARHYGGAEAGALASAGLSASADVLQGYVDKTPPLQVAANSPGVQGVSQIVVNYLKTKGFITQKTVDNIHAAAQIAEHATVSTVNDGP